MARGRSPVADENGARAQRATGRVTPGSESWARVEGAWAQADGEGREETSYIRTFTFDQTRATPSISLSNTGGAGAAFSTRDRASEQSRVTSAISRCTFEQKSPTLGETDLRSI